MAGQFTPTDVSLTTLLEDYNNYVLRPSTEKDLEDNPVINDRLHETHMNYLIGDHVNLIGSHVAGFFRLRNWKEKSELNNARIRKVFTRAEGDILIDWKGEDEASIKDRFTAALDGSYAAAYRLLVNGDEIYEDMKKMTWHVFKQYYNDGGRTVDEALGETLTLLYGDTVLERNGGIEFPNGVGLWHDRDMMNKYKVTLNEIEEYKINVFHHLIKKTTANGGNITLQFTNDDPEKSDIGQWSEVAQGIVEGGGNVWWGVINDVYTDGYRVVMLAQRGSSDASIEEAGRRMFTTPGSSLPSVEVIGDGYYNDGSGPKPIRLTKEQFFHAIAEAPAAEALSSNMDWWDSQHWLFNRDKNRKYGEPGGAILMRAAEDAGWFTQPGPDMSRKRIEHYVKKRGPGTKHYKETPRAWSFFGTGWGLDWSKPGRLEMDLLWMPLWKDIQELEGKNPPGYRVTQDELRTLFRNRYRSMFKGRNDPGLRRTFSLYDMFYIMSNSTSIRYQAEAAMTDPHAMRGLVNVSGYVPGEEE